MLARAKKWGNSVALVISADAAAKEHIRPGEVVELVVRERIPPLEELGGTVRLRHKLPDLLHELNRGWNDF